MVQFKIAQNFPVERTAALHEKLLLGFSYENYRKPREQQHRS